MFSIAPAPPGDLCRASERGGTFPVPGLYPRARDPAKTSAPSHGAALMGRTGQVLGKPAVRGNMRAINLAPVHFNAF
jgi:hypothetical protein